MRVKSSYSLRLGPSPTMSRTKSSLSIISFDKALSRYGIPFTSDNRATTNMCFLSFFCTVLILGVNKEVLTVLGITLNRARIPYECSICFLKYSLTGHTTSANLKASFALNFSKPRTNFLGKPEYPSVTTTGIP